MASDDLVVQFGLPASFARAAAEVYYEAFSAKMRPLLRSEEHGVAVLQTDLRLENAVGALLGPTLAGLAGLRFGRRRFWVPRLAGEVQEFGWLGGPPRAALFALIAAGGGHAGQLYIEALAVRGQYRGRGVGTRLLQECEAIARAEGLEALSLDVVDTNARARALYERFGFVPVKTRRLPLARVAGFTAIIEMIRPLR